LEFALVFDSLKLDIAHEDSGVEESNVEELTEWEDLKDIDWAQKQKAEKKGICDPTQ
jgi:hypothetical protein